jgi:hypothetical protein
MLKVYLPGVYLKCALTILRLKFQQKTKIYLSEFCKNATLVSS